MTHCTSHSMLSMWKISLAIFSPTSRASMRNRKRCYITGKPQTASLTSSYEVMKFMDGRKSFMEGELITAQVFREQKQQKT